MRKKSIITITIALLAVLIFSLIIYGCLYDPDDDPATKMHPSYKNFTGTASGQANGYKSIITVDVTLEEGYIKSVDISHEEDREYADKAVETAKTLIVAINSFEIIDAVSGATVTLTGIKNAGENALRSEGLIGGD